MSDRIKASPDEIRSWSLEQAEEAHMALDIAEDTAILVERALEAHRAQDQRRKR